MISNDYTKFSSKRRSLRYSNRILLLMGTILLIVVYFYSDILVDKSIIMFRNENKGQMLSGSFTLRHIYRHGVDKGHRTQEVLDITKQNEDAFGRYFKRELDEFNANAVGLNTDDPLRELWTSDKQFITDNPFNFKFGLKGNKQILHRMVDRDPSFIEPYLDFARESPDMAAKVTIDWVEGGEVVVVPDITDKNTVVSLALMSSNAYVRLPYTDDWRNVSLPWDSNDTPGYGWESNGIRGHVFVNDLENIVVISIKGTSAQGLPGSGEDETTGNDKLNDNLLFSCCCARVSYLWTTVCDCYLKSYTCDETCLEQAIKEKDHYYQAAMDIYKDTLRQYPHATIWLTGHSLGGALASLVGRTYGLPTVAFESPGELLAAKRLHLPFPPGLPSYDEGIWHIGHTADPIYMGTCNGASSTCSIAGYAMETGCHSGKQCVYDVVRDKGWHVNMLNHRIHTVIDGILTKYDKVATCHEPDPCVDCYNWNFMPHGKKPKKQTTSSSSEKVDTSTTKSIDRTTITTRTNEKKWHPNPKDPSTTTTDDKTLMSSCLHRNWVGICTEYTTFTKRLI
ncbi:hypothetical protein Kpol_1028p44 [Vanderwaltozyma polyspora DSM 70294]|uniref:Putative lipase ATG15 n=1 Tax=Vanderwaltozyma polyspora (strain ATCC 22028 / DSM 70294 / BCRC 21397 / CBS 2163 / NBRC 10782 / NRRL Y-8283 / UCD 57-17) TaxID=436907 RepID=ATG15_VANPO|nr:uncharacterized protein Kpol_1028p44 [Vanderwaltozyma polyspora DSM 70294]A7TG13.1 RecName: Full=Putative lipase ATG15; AltName: Full=Autophagy-related protein 15 [Vanderwaltozyma polyspora DSM 70294]EDO18770.1 hypothetical protein Kpol_1028p44 [Vanderwaltozyma polyspora DSM 70294]